MAKKQPKMTVRQFHTLGQRVLKATARRKRRGEGTWGLLEELGAKTAAEKNRLQEARHFAQRTAPSSSNSSADWVRIRADRCHVGTWSRSSAFPIEGSETGWPGDVLKKRGVLGDCN